MYASLWGETGREKRFSLLPQLLGSRCYQSTQGNPGGCSALPFPASFDAVQKPLDVEL